MRDKRVITPEMNELLKRVGSSDYNVSIQATAELATALSIPLRDGLMPGDIHSDIFTEEVLQPGAIPEYPLSFLAPGTEKDFVAYTISNHGRIPDRTIAGDYITIPTYRVANSIDWLKQYARDARWPIVDKATQVYMAGFTKKLNDDAWHTLLAAGAERNILVYDSAASAGQFTKRLVSLIKTVMRRNGGGNSTSINRKKLTDLYLSPESVEDIRDWGVDQVDEVTRREIYTAADGSINRIFNVNLHDIDELGESQEYQTYFTGILGGSLQASDVELVVGLDLSDDGVFMKPVRQQIETKEDPTLDRSGKAGIYGDGWFGFGCLDVRDVILASL
jgi:hypothetical protein